MVADAIDNIWDPKKNEKLLNDRSRIENHPQRMEQYFMFLYLASCIDNNSKQNDIVDYLNNKSYVIENTSRNSSMNALYILDIDKVDDKVLSFVLQQGIVSCFSVSRFLSFERLIRVVPKEYILKQIQSGSFPLKEFIDVYWFYNLQANPDGMWILDNMTDDKKYDLYEYLNKRYWSDYMSFSW